MDFSFMLFVLLLVLISYMALKDLYLRCKPEYYASLTYPGAKLMPMIGGLFTIPFMNCEELFQYLRDMALKFKRTRRQKIFDQIHLHVIRAKEAEIILSSTKHINKSMLYHFIEPFVGEGLVTSQGSKWQARRKIITPTFHFNILQQFMCIFHEESDKMSQRLEIEVDKPEGTDIIPISTQFALNTICDTAMGMKLDKVEGGSEYHEGLNTFGRLIVYRLIHPWIYPDWIYNFFGYRRQLDKILVPLHSLTRNIINERRKQFNELILNSNNNSDDILEDNIYETKKRRYALLDTLLAAEREGLIDQDGVCEEVDTFMFTGHDTTALGITFTFLLLAHNSEIQDQIAEEARQVLAESDAEYLSKSDIENFKLLDRVIKESLRLYPPGSIISRALEDELVIDNMVFNKETIVYVHIYDLHRDPEVFPDPEKFDPDRFLPENCIERHPYAYIPFSAGPRNCVGQKYAVLEMKTAITNILMKYKLHPITTREEVVFSADMILRSKNPIKMRFTLRD